MNTRKMLTRLKPKMAASVGLFSFEYLSADKIWKLRKNFLGGRTSVVILAASRISTNNNNKKENVAVCTVLLPHPCFVLFHLISTWNFIFDCLQVRQREGCQRWMLYVARSVVIR